MIILNCESCKSTLSTVVKSLKTMELDMLAGIIYVSLLLNRMCRLKYI